MEYQVPADRQTEIVISNLINRFHLTKFTANKIDVNSAVEQINEIFQNCIVKELNKNLGTISGLIKSAKQKENHSDGSPRRNSETHVRPKLDKLIVEHSETTKRHPPDKKTGNTHKKREIWKNYFTPETFT